MHLLNKIVIPRIRANWRDVAYSMGCSVYDVDAIQEESHDLKQCCHKLFSGWLKTSRHPTWGLLLKRIKDVDDLSAASEEIEKRLQALSKIMHDIKCCSFDIPAHFLILCTYIAIHTHKSDIHAVYTV